MSDDDRIKSLIVDVIHSMSNDMADRIEELEAENMGLRLELQHANDAADEAIERAKKLEAKLATCEIYRDAYDNIGKIGAKYIEELEPKLHKYDVLVKELFRLLDITEQTDEGRVFRPNRISSCRALDAEKLNQVLKELKNVLEDRG